MYIYFVVITTTFRCITVEDILIEIQLPELSFRIELRLDRVRFMGKNFNSSARHVEKIRLCFEVSSYSKSKLIKTLVSGVGSIVACFHS